MIRRISHIRNFGIFRDFQGGEDSDIPEFKKLNLLYGWNYSGKTTLSRVFRAIERNEIPKEYAQSSFTVVLDDGLNLSSANLSKSPMVRVFNRDYITVNFQQEHSAPAVFIVGEENVALKTRHSQLQRRLERVGEIRRRIAAKQRGIKDRINQAGTDKARDVSRILGDRNFRRPKLEQRIREIRDVAESFLLDEDVVEAKLATLRSTENYQPIDRVALPTSDLSKLVQEVNKLLGQSATYLAIEKLKRDPALEQWVRKGLELHSESENCAFCGSPLTSERFEVLRRHFSHAYEILVSQLEEKFEQLNQIQFDFKLPHEKELLPDFRSEFAACKQKLENWVAWGETIKGELIEALKSKKGAIETKNALELDMRRSGEIKGIVSDINSLIDGHNNQAGQLSQTKSNARQQLERHYAVEHFLDYQIADKEEEVGELSRQINRTGAVELRITSDIDAIEEQINRSVIGATRLNELLTYILAGSDIRVECVGESEFRFIRGGKPATNLSDGEKTAITFAHFLTSLEADGASPEDAIVFIDDPISSLDSNHIYAVFALITERLEKCQQLFVSTHNSEFFNLLKSRWLNRRNQNNTSTYYVARKIGADGVAYAELSKLPKLLRKYKSEYEFLFSQLYAFANKASPSDHEAYTAPNLLRKFLESYLGFRKPDISAWHEKLDLLFDTPEQCREIHKFADDGSHLQSLSRSMQQPAFISSAQRLVNDVLRALKDRDPGHYSSLLAVVSGD